MNVEISLTVTTCSCGGVYAAPSWMTITRVCPMCGYRERKRLIDLVETKSREIQHLRRVNASLRGALTVARRKVRGQ